MMRARRGPGAATHGPRDGGLGGGGHPVADRDPIDKGKVNEVVFSLLDHLDEWYGHDAEIGHVLVVARVREGERLGGWTGVEPIGKAGPPSLGGG